MQHSSEHTFAWIKTSHGTEVIVRNPAHVERLLLEGGQIIPEAEWPYGPEGPKAKKVEEIDHLAEQARKAARRRQQ